MTENNKKSYYARLTGFNRAVPIILWAVALFIGLCFILQDTGSFGKAISGILLGLFSYGAYSIPVLIALHALLYPSDVAKRRRISRLIFSVVFAVLFASTVYALSHLDGELVFDPAAFYTDGQSLVGGGLVGSVVAFGIIKAIGIVGFFIVAVAVIAIYATYFIARNNVSATKSFYNFMSGLVGIFARAESKIKKSKKSRESATAEKRRRADDKKRHDLYHDDYFEVDNGMQELSINELNIQETRSAATSELNPKLKETVHHKSEISKEEAARDDERREAERREAEAMRRAEAMRKEETAKDEPRPSQKRSLDLDYGMDSTPFVQRATETAPEPQPAKTTSGMGLDEDAASVFTRDFDPFDFATAEKLASKRSSRSVEVTKTEEHEGIGVYEENISSVSDAELEMARRKEEFERRKRLVIERENAYRQAKERTDAASSEPTPEVKEAPVSSEPIPKVPVAEEPVVAVREEITPEFKPYQPPTVSDSIPEVREEVIKIERSMLDPEPEAPTYSTEERRAYTYEPTPAEELTEELPVSDYAPAPAVLDTDDEETEENTVVTEMPAEELTEAIEVIPEEEQSKVLIDQRRMFSIFDSEDKPLESVTKTEEITEDTSSDTLPTVEVSEDYSEDSSEDIYVASDEKHDDIYLDAADDEEDTLPETTADDTDEEDELPPFDYEDKTTAVVVKETPKAPPKPDYSDYRFPPLDLLGVEDRGNDDLTNYETSENGNKLIETLLSFNVTASIKGFDRGPRITRYEVVPAKGVKVSAIMGLKDDIALNLASEGIRMEAPIPGKSAVGVEIPNSQPYTVKLRSLLECEEFKSSKSNTVVCVGKDVAGQPVFGDISKMPHLLIAGATGMGKSVCINSLLLSMLYKAKPDEVKFIMIDPKKVEFNIYNGIPHLLIPVVTDPKQAAGALMWAVEQMEKRYEIIEKARVRNIDAYNAKVIDNPGMGEPMPKIVIVIDELADLMLQAKNPVESLIMSISAKARAAGIHLIIGTQRPSVDIITGVIKANIPTRIACKVMSNADSRTILDATGAEDLLDKGDMLFNVAAAPKPKRVQGAFVSDSEVENIIDFIKAQAPGNVYDDQAIEEINRAAQKCNKEKGGAGARGEDDDGADTSVYDNPEFLEAVDVALASGKISTSLLQRKMSIGFGKASKYLDIMEEIGIVSGLNGQKPRDVLITKDEWREKCSRVSLD